MRRIFIIVGLSVLAVGCSDIFSEDAVTDQTADGSSAEALGGPIATDDYSDSERLLLDHLVEPADLSAEYKFNLVQVDDPNGDGTIGEYWYPPRLLEADCSVRTDQAPIPTVKVGYIPGRPEDSKSDSPFSSMQASHNLSVQISFFDNAEQRDSFSSIMKEFLTLYYSEDFCKSMPNLESLAGEQTEIEPPNYNDYEAYGYKSESKIGSGIVYYYNVGDRVFLTISAGHPTLMDENRPGSPDEESLQDLLDLQISKLQENGLG